MQAVPSFAKEGWTRPKENAAKHPLKGADGVVVSSYRLFMPNGFINRWLEATTPPSQGPVVSRSFARRGLDSPETCFITDTRTGRRYVDYQHLSEYFVLAPNI